MSTFFQFLADHAGILSLGVLTIGGFVVAYLKHSGHATMALVAQAFTDGSKAAVVDIGQGKDPSAALVDGVMAAARDLGVQDHPAVLAHVEEVKNAILPSGGGTTP